MGGTEADVENVENGGNDGMEEFYGMKQSGSSKKREG